MDLTKLFDAQKELDDRIVEEKGLQGKDLLDKKILALQVELGELANEWRGFKFWSEDQEPREEKWIFGACETCDGSGHLGPDGDCNKCLASGEVIVGTSNPLLEEYVDCLHFVLSIGNELEYNSDPINTKDMGEFTLVELFNDLFFLVHMLKEKSVERDDYKIALRVFLWIGKMLGFTREEIEQAYFDKNKVNHERQQNGY